jgi:hypothetical protein
MRERIIAILQKYEEQPFSRPSECADEIMALFKVAEMPTEEELISIAERSSKVKLSEREKIFIRMTRNIIRNRMKGGERQLWRDIQEREREGFCSPAHSSPKNIDSSKTPENI